MSSCHGSMSSWLDSMSIRRVILSNWHAVISKYHVVVEKRRETLTCPHKCQWMSLTMCEIIIFRLRFEEHRSKIYTDNLYINLHLTRSAADNLFCGDEHASRSSDLIKIICILFFTLCLKQTYLNLPAAVDLWKH